MVFRAYYEMLLFRNSRCRHLSSVITFNCVWHGWSVVSASRAKAYQCAAASPTLPPFRNLGRVSGELSLFCTALDKETIDIYLNFLLNFRCCAFVFYWLL